MRLINLSKNFSSAVKSPLIFESLSSSLKKVTLNRPKALNALNQDDCIALNDILLHLKQD